MKKQESQVEKYLAEQRYKAEARCKDYLYNHKVRKPYYTFSGVCDDEEGDEMKLSLHFPHDKFNNIIRLFIDVYNKKNPSNSPVTTIDELKQNCRLYELKGINPKLDTFFKKIDDYGLLLYEIESQPHYYYKMSYYFWNSVEQKMSKRYSFTSELSDDEYLLLLTEQLLNRLSNSYNRLVFDHPDLAEKISGDAESLYYDDTKIDSNPYLIIFDEVLEDAEAIDGPASVSDELYFDNRLHSQYCICAHTDGHKLTICEDDWTETIPIAELRNLENIDADKVQKLAKARNYSQMLVFLKKHCKSSSAFEDIKAWLDSNHLTYNETKGDLSNKQV